MGELAAVGLTAAARGRWRGRGLRTAASRTFVLPRADLHSF